MSRQSSACQNCEAADGFRLLADQPDARRAALVGCSPNKDIGETDDPRFAVRRHLEQASQGPSSR